MNRNKKTSLIIGIALCIVTIIILWLSTIITPEDIQNLLIPWGSWAPIAYIGLFAVLPAFFFPVAILAFAGGLLFGLWLGSIYTFIGAIINCSLMFLTARFIGYNKIKQLISKKLGPEWQQRLNKADGKAGFFLLIILRLIPAVPYNLINYGFGLSGMRFFPYILASAIGIIPGTLVFINIGDKSLDITSPAFWLAIILLIALLIITGLLGKKLFPPATSKTEVNYDK